MARMIGLDLAKNVFQVHGTDPAGRCVLRRRLRVGCSNHAKGAVGRARTRVSGSSA
jgi:hypothetical protein